MRIVLDSCEVDLVGNVALRGKDTVRLTNMESNLLKYLVGRMGQVVSRGELLEEVWGYRKAAVTRTVDSTIRRLRGKIESDPKAPHHLITVHGRGYQWVSTPTHEPKPEPSATNLFEFGDEFIGRDADLARISELFDTQCQLVTLVGPPGIGKTRLAWEFGLLATKRSTWDGVWFVDLTEALGKEEVLGVLSSTLDIPLQDVKEPVAHLSRVLAERPPSLIIIDNVEKVVDAVAGLVTELKQHSPKTALLLTSRRTLPVRHQVCYSVEPLHIEDGCLLFRTRMGRHHGPLREAQDEDVKQIVEKIEGFPLAIEL
ncbi:MAG: AAA family ATPase, partial [Proteobacteria bacterium]|nr:AAA family ATPase [Pseudomonadota bacterium]